MDRLTTQITVGSRLWTDLKDVARDEGFTLTGVVERAFEKYLEFYRNADNTVSGEERK